MSASDSFSIQSTQSERIEMIASDHFGSVFIQVSLRTEYFRIFPVFTVQKDCVQVQYHHTSLLINGDRLKINEWTTMKHVKTVIY